MVAGSSWIWQRRLHPFFHQLGTPGSTDPSGKNMVEKMDPEGPSGCISNINIGIFQAEMLVAYQRVRLLVYNRILKGMVFISRHLAGIGF